MNPVPREGLTWTIKTIGVSFLVSMLGVLVSLSLGELGEWPFPSYSEYVFAGICGAVAAYLMHPRRPFVVLVVFAPVMGVASFLATLFFYAYVLGATIEF